MSRTIRISFPKRPESLRAWIFAEDLSREFSESGLGNYPMAEADSVIDRIEITGIRARDAKRALELVRKTLARHNLEGDAIVELGPGTI
jgi:hypothetical protein